MARIIVTPRIETFDVQHDAVIGRVGVASDGGNLLKNSASSVNEARKKLLDGFARRMINLKLKQRGLHSTRFSSPREPELAKCYTVFEGVGAVAIEEEFV